MVFEPSGTCCARIHIHYGGLFLTAPDFDSSLLLQDSVVRIILLEHSFHIAIPSMKAKYLLHVSFVFISGMQRPGDLQGGAQTVQATLEFRAYL